MTPSAAQRTINFPTRRRHHIAMHKQSVPPAAFGVTGPSLDVQRSSTMRVCALYFVGLCTRGVESKRTRDDPSFIIVTQRYSRVLIPHPPLHKPLACWPVGHGYMQASFRWNPKSYILWHWLGWTVMRRGERRSPNLFC